MHASCGDENRLGGDNSRKASVMPAMPRGPIGIRQRWLADLTGGAGDIAWGEVVVILAGISGSLAYFNARQVGSPAN